MSKTLIASLVMTSMSHVMANSQIIDDNIQTQTSLTEINNKENLAKMKFLNDQQALRIVNDVVSSAEKTSEFANMNGLQALAKQHLDYQVKKINNFASGQHVSDTLSCSQWLTNTWYNLQPLMLNDNQFWQVNSHSAPNVQEEIIFNFCQTFDPTSNQTWSTCNTNRAGYLGMNTPSECHSLTAVNPEHTFSEMKDGDDKVIGINLEYDLSDEKCVDGDSNYGIKIQVKCNKNLEATEGNKITYLQEDNCKQIIQMESGAGCPAFDMNKLFEVLGRYSVLWGLILLAVGLLCAFFGRKLMKPVIFIITFMTVGFASLLIFYGLFLSTNNTTWVFWVMFVVCAILGIIAGFLGVKFPRVGTGFLTGLTGFFVAILLMQTFQLRNNIAFWIIASASFILPFGFAFIMSNYIIIISTAILGGYFTIRGISAFAGNFPNEFTIVQELQNGALESLPWQFYLYLVGMIGVAAIGAFIQIRKYKAEVGNHPYHHPNPYKNL